MQNSGAEVRKGSERGSLIMAHEGPLSARLAHSRLSWRRSPYPIDCGPSAGEAGASARAPYLPLAVLIGNGSVGWFADLRGAVQKSLSLALARRRGTGISEILLSRCARCALCCRRVFKFFPATYGLVNIATCVA